MNHPSRFLTLLAVLPFTAAGASATAPRYHVIYNFTGLYYQPNSIGEISPGTFYMLSSSEAVVSVTTRGVFNLLASFPPTDYLVEVFPTPGPNGLVYASVEQPNLNSGFVFSVTLSPGGEQNYPSLGLTPLLSGNLPDAKLFGLVYSFTNGNWYLGTSDLSGSVSTFYLFPTFDRPSPPILGSDGNYYGVDSSYAANYKAIFYKATPGGAFTQLASLPFTAPYPDAGVVLQGTEGNFYGVQGTGPGCGVGAGGGVYQLTPSGQYTLLHDFGTCNKALVDALIQASDGNLYGVTDDGLFFSLTTSGVYKNVYLMHNYNGLCTYSLIQGSDGILYGTAAGGGTTGSGVVFALDLGLPAPKPQALQFSPASGSVGAPVRIWGYNLLKSTVAFNGVLATSVRHSGPNYVWANVPPGAVTGPVTVSTPGGTSTTPASFVVQ